MKLLELELHHFRNYEEAQVYLDPGVNMICGENAQGKTNLLEAVYFLSHCKSFRGGNKKNILSFGENAGEALGKFDANSRENTIRIRLERSRSMAVWVNGVREKRQADVIGRLRTVLFCPEDLYLIREGAAARRRFMDSALCQLKPNYSRYLDEYHKLLEHKTRILRDSEEKPSLLDTLDDFTMRMCQVGGFLIRYRAYYLKNLEVHAKEIHGFMAGGREKLEMFYATVSGVSDPFASAGQITAQLWEHAQRHRKAEIAARSCLSGPHKDDLLLFLDGESAKDYGSQGQVRTAALALKLAEREMFYRDSGEYPILLLDDVLSELDVRRQDFVINQISGGQVLITCCEREKLSRVQGGKTFWVEGGKVRESDR